MGKLTERLKHAWNAFQRGNQDPAGEQFNYGSASYSVRQDRVKLNFSSERSIISSIYTRLSVDIAQVNMRHVRLDEEDRYIEEIRSGLNNCLTVEANVDQAARAFRQDIVLTILDKGVAAIVPVDTTLDPRTSGGFDIQTMRVGEIVNWYPQHVRVSVYNETKGYREDLVLPKRVVAIVENPLYAVMNEPNSTLQRLIRKLNLLDVIDDQIGSGKLDLIIQLPYVIKSEARREQAEQRRKDIEFQLKGSQYGIAYTDGAEKVTQLNRPAENNILKEIEYLVEMLYGQLGLTEGVMNGTADEKTMLNYLNRTVEPILTAIVEAMRRSFLTKTARSQRQSIIFIQDPFKLVPINDLANIADKFSRNEILSANEFRQFLGIKPSKDPRADELRNSNMPAPSESAPTIQEGDSQNDSS
jgi:putative sterol carrier protein